MTRRVRKAFTDNLKTADWMDYLTKENAKAKVNKQHFIAKLNIKATALLRDNVWLANFTTKPRILK